MLVADQPAHLVAWLHFVPGSLDLSEGCLGQLLTDLALDEGYVRLHWLESRLFGPSHAPKLGNGDRHHQSHYEHKGQNRAHLHYTASRLVL